MFALRFGPHTLPVTKIREEDFTPHHHDVLSEMRYEQDTLIFLDDRWQVRYLGAGEEKAVFCVRS